MNQVCESQGHAKDGGDDARQEKQQQGLGKNQAADFPFRGTQCDTQPDLAAAGLGPEIESAQDAQHDVNHQEDRYGVDAVELSVHLFGLFGFVVADRLHRSEKIRAEFELFGHLLAEPLREIFVRARFYAQCDLVTAAQIGFFAWQRIVNRAHRLSPIGVVNLSRGSD